MDRTPPAPDWPSYCAAITAAAPPLTGAAADGAGAGAYPIVQPDVPPPAALGHGLLARHWQALWPDVAERDSDPAGAEPPR